MQYKAIIISIALSTYSFGNSLLDEIVKNTNVSQFNIDHLEEELAKVKGRSMSDIIKRTQLEFEISEQKKLKAKFILDQALKNTKVQEMGDTKPVEARFSRRSIDLGSDRLNEVVDKTIEKSNPAIEARNLSPQGRPIMIGRDIDPDDLYYAKKGHGGEKVVVQKTKDLRGRIVYKDLEGRVVDNIISGKVFEKNDVIYRDEKGNLSKGYPKAIYSDGTLEFRDQYGMTQRRKMGHYHLSDDISSVRSQSITTHSGKTLSVYDDLESDKGLSAREKKAIGALRKVMCDL